MAVNQYLNNYNHPGEQNLFNNLVVELIKMYGVDVIYLPRSGGQVDEIMNENRTTIYDKAFEIEVYVKSADSFSGEGDFLSKFGLQISDQAVLSVAISRFKEVLVDHPEIHRPNEGDLVYLPFVKSFFRIMHTEHESVFYQNGRLQVYDLKVELMTFSNEKFETGVDYIDTFFDDIRTDGIETLTDLADQDVIAKNIYFDDEGDDILDISEFDPFQEIISYPRKV